MKTNKNKKDIVLTPEEVAQFRALGWEGIMNKAKSYNPNAEKKQRRKAVRNKSSIHTILLWQAILPFQQLRPLD